MEHMEQGGRPLPGAQPLQALKHRHWESSESKILESNQETDFPEKNVRESWMRPTAHAGL